MRVRDLDTDTIVKIATLKREEESKMKVFDWHKAARIIVKYNAKKAKAGLAEDWFWTGGIIFEDEPVENEYAYLASVWATPIIVLNDDEDGIECWCWEDECDWDAKSMWPDSALELWEMIKDGRFK